MTLSDAVRRGGVYLKRAGRELLIPRLGADCVPFWTSGHPKHGGSVSLTQDEIDSLIPWYRQLAQQEPPVVSST